MGLDDSVPLRSPCEKGHCQARGNMTYANIKAKQRLSLPAIIDNVETRDKERSLEDIEQRRAQVVREHEF